MSMMALIKKEVKELLTPATILPIIAMTLLFGMLGNAIGGAVKEAREKPSIGVVNVDDGKFSDIIKEECNKMARVIYNGSSKEDIEEGLNILKNKGSALIFIPANFSEEIYKGREGKIYIYWIMRGAGIMDSIPFGAIESILTLIEREISTILVEEKGVNASALSPLNRSETTILKGIEMQGVSPGIISNMISSQSTTVPIIMMIIIIMAGGMVISSMGMEKENKTLETLLTLPIKRRSIVIGKIVGSAIVGLLMAVIYMIGFSYYIQSFQQTLPLNLADYGLSLSFLDYILIGLSVFLALTAALSLCMVLGTFAKNYKSAQTLTLPVSLLALLPMFMIMFKDFDTLPLALKIILFAIPFSHPMMAMRSLIFKDYALVIGGIAYVTVFAFAFIALAVYIFNTDKLLTGRIKRGK
ncbi:MAG: ABC transporter permease [Thermoplasmata archaeon]|nr:MAG: ABC transporter permease [Thermoplasmata archaeon]